MVDVLKDLEKNKYLLKAVIERLFSFSELDDYFENVDANTGNIYCKFHPYEGLGENSSSAASRMYYNEEKGIQNLHCFTSKRNYTVYHYIKFVLEQDPYTYLINNKDKNEIILTYNNIVKGYINVNDDTFKKKVEYVDNTFCNTGNTVDYIEALYNPKGE